MPKSNAGFTPRDLDRRKFQEAIAAALDQHADFLTQLAASAKVSREFTADLSARLDVVSADVASHTGRDFMARLRWLFTGK